MPVQKKPVGRPLPSRPGPAAEEQEQEHEQEQQQAPRSRADAFNDAKPETGFGVPPGPYQAHLVGAVREIDGQKESVKVSYEVAEGEEEGKTINAWYNLFSKDGVPMKGAGFMKRDFEILGQPELDYDQLDEQLEALQAERLLCNLTVKQNGQWTNVYLQGLAEGT